jgi:hypothetical protein
MSIGNLKTQGGKGTNYPFQSKVLQGLQCACDQLKAIGADTTAIEATLLDIETAIGNLATEATLQVVETNTTGVARTPGIIRPINVTGNLNTVAATFYSVSVANVGSANGGVLGTVIKPGEILNFSADALNNFFTSFAYDATGTEFVITYIA